MSKTIVFVLFLMVTLFAAPSLSADETAIRKMVEAYVEAFNQHDLKAVAAFWAKNGAHSDLETGSRTEGREEIEKDIAAAFEARPNLRLAGSVDRVRLIKPEVARIEGQTTISAPDEEPSLSTFSAILINEDGKWLIDSLDESPVPAPATPHDALRELEWLVGRWVDESEEARVDTTVRWTTDRAFLLRSFVIETEGEITRQGTQVIGWDPRSKHIRSWSFNSDGSFGDGVWSKNGEDWMIKSSQTLVDGQAASGTYVLTRVDDNTITLRLIGHEVEGEPQPAGKSVKVVRVVEEQQPEPEKQNKQ